MVVDFPICIARFLESLTMSFYFFDNAKELETAPLLIMNTPVSCLSVSSVVK